MSIQLSAIQLYYNSLGRIVPKFAAKQAARLFLTPMPRKPASKWTGKLVDLLQTDRLTFNGEELEIWKWQVDRPTVLIVHGWGSNAQSMEKVIERVLEAGMGVVTFDGPAHGSSSAKQTNMCEFSLFISMLCKELPQIRATIGHSFGAASVAFACGRGLPVERVVLISPFARSDKNLSKFASFLKFSNKLEQDTRDELIRFFADDAEGWDLVTYAGQLKTPALIIHDDKDKEVEFSEGKDLADSWSGAVFHATSKLGHRRTLKDKATVNKAIEFIRTIGDQAL